MASWIKFAFLALCMVFGLAFHLRNDHRVVLDYFLGVQELYFSIWLLIALSIGVFLGFLVSLQVILRLQRINARLCRQARGRIAADTRVQVIPARDH